MYADGLKQTLWEKNGRGWGVDGDGWGGYGENKLSPCSSLMYTVEQEELLRWETQEAKLCV